MKTPPFFSLLSPAGLHDDPHRAILATDANLVLALPGLPRA